MEIMGGIAAILTVKIQFAFKENLQSFPFTEYLLKMNQDIGRR
jgi:hypothetical protein